MTSTPIHMLSRRALLRTTAAAVAGVAAYELRSASATPAAMSEAIRKVTGIAKVTKGRIKVDVPPLSENGNLVPCTISVQSPMTQADHVRAIHVFNEKNPQPNVVSIRLGPRAGVATVTTRMRLTESQNVVVVAEMSDGSFWTEQDYVIVTQGACLEDSP
jgi:sulfur-oxidizing protein SoxY